MSSAISASAKGATFLVLLQLTSRVLSFGINQILLRYHSPALFGASAQLELYFISALYLSRESIRIALQRQTTDAQGILNISYISIGLCIVLSPILAWVYSQLALLDVPFATISLVVYFTAVLVEISSEPCFILVQYRLAYAVRAQAEAAATVCRCTILLAVTIWASRNTHDLGVLPFAIAQLAYAVLLTGVYFWRCSGLATREALRLRVTSLHSEFGSLSKSRAVNQHVDIMFSDSRRYFLSRFPRSACILAFYMYVQTTIKYILTQGDAIITSSVTSLHEQGAYGLASNYGGLLARTFFQPIEESSRNLFAKLCTTGQERSPARTRALLRAHAVLRDIIKAYNLLALLAWAVGPLLAPPLLQVIAGNRWIEAGAGDVLAVYCYYIPLLALNGVSEAFVAAVANEEDLRKQSSFMGVYSVIFASAAFILIKVMKLGASGIVWANCLNMSLRIVFNRAYIENFFGSQGQATSYTETLPRIGSISAALGAATVLRGATPFPIFSGASPTEQLMKGGLVAVLCSTYLIYSERKFLSNAYSLITKADGEPTEQSKEGAGNAPNL